MSNAPLKNSVRFRSSSLLFTMAGALALSACALTADDADDPRAEAVAPLSGEVYPLNIQSTSLFFWSRAEFGQSFRPTSATTMRHIDGCFSGASVPHHVALRGGDGITGPVLATTTQITDTHEPCVSGSTLYTYQRATFGADLVLSAGAAYTAHFSAGGPTGTTPSLGLWVTWSNPYSGGVAMDYYNGAERRYPTWDFIFRIVQAN